MDAILEYIYGMKPSEFGQVFFELLLIGIFVYIILSFLEGTR